MWLMKPDGGWAEASARHPESLIIFAPPEMQEACVRQGGRNEFGEPNYRLVWLASRFQISGGLEVNFYDIHGNYVHGAPSEVFIPRYPIPDGYEDSWVLEEWRSADWYHQHGFGTDADIEWSAENPTECIRQLEPVWSRGGYEAVPYDIKTPWCFLSRYQTMIVNGKPREFTPVSVFTIEKAIRLYKERKAIRTAEVMKLYTERLERQAKESHFNQKERILDNMPPFALADHVGYTGARG